ncbi:MAG: hypothetical protein KAS32_30780 [Candidatus Peribacteraceae bacterium]|nr:hypothetical protein [Candidatus Peribacteraceae bacterium]
MSTNSKWKNTSASFRIAIIFSLICVYIFYFITFDFSKDYILLSWPIVISIGIIAFASRMMKTLKYRLQKRFVKTEPFEISKGVSVSLNNLELQYTIEHNIPIAFNPEVVADTVFIMKNLGIKIGLVSFKKGTWVFIMYNKNTSTNELIKICKEIDDMG